jgi:uncharacterized protein (TIRG00374 family)
VFALGITVVSFILRVVRWIYIMPSEHRISFGRAFRVLMAGFLANIILPARLGEVGRAAFVKPRGINETSIYLGTIFAEHVFNLLALVTIGLAVIVGIDFQLFSIGKLSMLVFGTYVSLMILKYFICSEFMAETLEFHGKDSGFKGIIFRILSRVHQGLQLFHSWKKIFWAFLISMIVWILSGVMIYVVGGDLIEGFLLSWGFVLTVVIALSMLAPAAPAYVGTYQFVVVYVLGYYGISREEAFAFSIVLHSIVIFGILLSGLLAYTAWLAEKFFSLKKKQIT